MIEREQEPSEDEHEGEEHALPKVRLNKYIADHGVASRRACDQLISEGRVRVNGRVVSDLGVKVDPASDEVQVDDDVLALEPKVYYLLYKPKGVVCTNGTSHGRPRAIDLLKPRVKERVYCVGRLDEDSEGLILVTNDGAFAQRIAHPRHQVPKTYHLKLQGSIDSASVERAQKGIHLAEGRTAGAKIMVLRRGATASNLLVTLREGRNREIRRVFARLGHPVKSLVRVRIGTLTTTGLKRGSYRALRKSEVRELLESAAHESAPPPGLVRRKQKQELAERKRRAFEGKRRGVGLPQSEAAARPPRPDGERRKPAKKGDTAGRPPRGKDRPPRRPR
ncbi:MAG: rRNA pseudouridine synthase [Planctomycetes bacterium]|nr:rRNA pseudouridine synthase [Planctomycetota bacterium]